MATTPRNILVVEDEALIAMAISLEVSDRGHRIIGPAHALGQARKMLDTETIDGAILDVQLGKDEVFPIALQLSKRGIPFIFHSGHITDESQIDEAYAAPLYGKPTDTGLLVDSLVDLINSN